VEKNLKEHELEEAGRTDLTFGLLRVTVVVVFKSVKLLHLLPIAVLLLAPVLSPGAIKSEQKNHLQDAEDALRDNRVDDALTALDAAIQDDPDNAAAHFWRGRLRAGKGEYEKALPDLNAAIRLQPSADAYAHRGYVFQKQHDLDNALGDFNQALRLDGNNYLALFLRGLLLGDLGNTKAALGDLDAALTQQPDNREAIQARGQVHVLRAEKLEASRKEELEAALKDFEHSIQLDPKDANGHTGRGGVNYLKGDFKEAVEDYTQAVELLPNDPQPLAQRGYAYAGLGEMDKALTDFSAALKINAKDIPALLGRAEIYRTKKQWADALGDYDVILAAIPGDFRALLGQASALYGSGELEKAVGAYGDLMQRFPTEAQPFNDCAWLLATGTKDGVRNGQRAVELANQACQLTNYQNAGYLDTLAAAFAEKGEFDKARQWQEAAIKAAGEEPPDVQEEIKARIDLYKQNKPYREVLK
jgi:tetratricopeptide (TPR) repeat protein